MIDRFRAHLREAGLFPDPGLVLVAVSGGPDSVALLRLLHTVADEFGLTLGVAHVHHGIHPDSAAWADRVRQLGEGLGRTVRVTSLGMGPGTTETAARAARYAALDAMMLEADARYLATAHHADDQIETVLFRVLRGSAPAGLAGMQPVRGWLVRPLLPFRRAELTPFTDGAVRDPANDDHGHDRSWIRGALLPLLRERFGAQVEDNLLALAAHAAEDRAAWSQAVGLVSGLRPVVTEGRVVLRRKALAALPVLLAAAVVRALARDAGLVLRPRHAARLVAFCARPEGGRTLELGGGLEARVAGGEITLTHERPT